MLYDNPHFSRIQHRLQASEKTRSPPFPLRLGVSGPVGAAAERLQDTVGPVDLSTRGERVERRPERPAVHEEAAKTPANTAPSA